MHTYVIAEAGSTHDGSMDMALELIQRAKDAGADACKFQFWSSAERLAERRRAPEYREVYAKYQIHKPSLAILANECKDVGIDFMCTTYLPEDIAAVAPYVAKFKVASFEALDTNFILDHMSYYDQDVIVSTGMMDGAETERLLLLRDHFTGIKLLHCVSAYPTPPESVNLAVIRELGLDGFSDHTNMEEMGGLAVAAGAQIIEVHFRHKDTAQDNPDFNHSLAPYRLHNYIAYVREAGKFMGSKEKVPQAVEAEMSKYRVVR